MVNAAGLRQRAGNAMAQSLLSSGRMNVSLYQAAAAMNASTRWQETIAENLTSGSIPGSRKQQVAFSAVEAGMANGLSGQNSSRYVIPQATTVVNFLQGEMRPGSGPTDLAIEGPAFFEVQLPTGALAYTRDGELHLNAQGQLVTKQGQLVLGDSGPIQLDPSNPTPLSVSPTGEVSQGGEAKGRIKLAEFNNPGLLTSIGGGCFLANHPSLEANAVSTSAVRQGFLEAPNSSPTTEMASLLTSMRMFEANQKVLQMQDERMGRIISELGNPT